MTSKTDQKQSVEEMFNKIVKLICEHAYGSYRTFYRNAEPKEEAREIFNQTITQHNRKIRNKVEEVFSEMKEAEHRGLLRHLSEGNLKMTIDFISEKVTNTLSSDGE